MEGLRVLSGDGLVPLAPCNRCQAAGCPWDRIVDKPICPDCQELLVQGEGAPLIERVEKKACAACQQVGTIRYITYPLHEPQAIEINLCPRHFHALLGRRLDRYAYWQLGRQLQTLGLKPRQIFLLHEAFYDENGHPLQPVME
jgi:hypothetical protein